MAHTALNQFLKFTHRLWDSYMALGLLTLLGYPTANTHVVRATDAAGNTSTVSDAVRVTVDTSSPTPWKTSIRLLLSTPVAVAYYTWSVRQK
jgi:hypothetical protein